MSPVRTMILDAHEIDVAGVSALLRRFEDRIRLVDSGCPATQLAEAEVILYGVREEQEGHDGELHRLLRHQSATVIVLDWGPDARPVEWALSCGAHGRLSKTMTGEQIVAGLEAIHVGRDLASTLPDDGHCHPAMSQVGLTPRERQVLSLITRGHTNQEIAEEIFVSINSVKTYVRSAYRKIGALRRAQAVSWGVQHGLDADTSDGAEVPVPVA